MGCMPQGRAKGTLREQKERFVFVMFVRRGQQIACTSLTVLNFAFWVRTTKGEELSWNDPVQVPILRSLVVLVFFHVKAGKVQPAVLKSLGIIREGLSSFGAVMLVKTRVNPIKITLFTARRQSRIFRLYMHVPKEASLKQIKSFNITELPQSA